MLAQTEPPRLVLANVDTLQLVPVELARDDLTGGGVGRPATPTTIRDTRIDDDAVRVGDRVLG